MISRKRYRQLQRKAARRADRRMEEDIEEEDVEEEDVEEEDAQVARRLLRRMVAEEEDRAGK